MKVFFLFPFLIISFLTLSAQRLPQYDITVTLNDRDNTLDGFLTLNYTNNYSDSVHFLWFNIYPNAFKSDRTMFSEYMLGKGKTDFYFSNPADRGYINRLDFRSGDNILKTEDHPQYIDIVKVNFERPLAPGDSKTITTPFHVKLPYNFDGIGYKDRQYDLKFWYPAVAEYIRPFTSVDSSSNLFADYLIKLTLKRKFSVTSPFLTNQPSKAQNTDSLITIELSASSVKDVPVTITKPQVKSTLKSASSEHDIFKFFSGSAKRSTNTPKKDSLINREIKRLLSRPILPAAGYNEYDGFQIGVLTHNYGQRKRFSYYLAPLYTFKSKSIAGVAGASYQILPNNHVIPNRAKGTEQSAQSTNTAIETGFTASTFSYNDGIDVNDDKVFAKLIKAVPFVKISLPSRLPHVEKTITFKTYIISERDLQYKRDSVYPTFRQEEGDFLTRYLNEISFDYSSDRALYPYRAQLQVQQGNNWYRLNATGNYFFNYAKGGGMNVRVFAAKFGYIGNVSSAEKFNNLRYMPKLTAVRGGEDYTYSNYFIGRNSFDRFASRQIVMRDGGLKLRTDLFEGLQGRSDDWVASANFNTTIPQLFPVKIPVKIFFDAGTYSEAWDNDNPNPRFLYVAGLQLSLFKDVLNIYAPVFYSKQFRDQLKSVPEENKFLKKVSFSIDIQKIDLKKLF